MKSRRSMLNKIIIIIFAIILVSIIFPQKSSAISFKNIADSAGKVLDNIFALLNYIGDAVMDLLQKQFVAPHPAIIIASTESHGYLNGLELMLTVFGLTTMIIGIFITGGFLANIGVAAASVVIKGATIGTLVFITGGATTLAVGKEFNGWSEKDGFDIPMMEYTPYTIFTGQVPAFDVNFIDPMDDIIITRNRIESNWEGRSYTNLLRLKDNENAPQPIYTYGGYGEIFASSNGRANSHPDTYSSLENAGLAGAMDAATANAMNLYGFEESDKLEVSDENKTWSGNKSGTIYVYRVRKVYLKRSTNKVLMEYEYFVSGGGFYSLSGYVSVWDLSNVEESEVVSVAKYESTAKILQNSISTWYNALRKFALVVLLSILVFIAIKIILTSVAEEKAKYKRFFIDWLIAVCLLFVLHYIMIFVLTISENLTEIFLHKSSTTIQCKLPDETKIDGVKLINEFIPGTNSGDIEVGKEGELTWVGDFVGYIRLQAGLTTRWEQVQYSLIYLVLVVDTCIFTVMYIKRTLYMAFFTMIAPLIAVTYPLDKIKDGQAQAFNLWFKEYTFNALIQPVHLIIYTMTLSTVMDMLVINHPIYALIALGFIMPAEKFLRKMFGFEKATTLGAMGQMAGGAVLYSGIKKLAGLGSKKQKNNEEQEKLVRTENNSKVKFANPEGSNEEETNSKTEDDADKKDESDGILENEETETNENIKNAENIEEKSRTTQEKKNAEQKTKKVRMNNHSVIRGLNRLGVRARKKALKAKPLRAIGRFSGKILGGAALGSIGLVAGIASGDLSKVATYTIGAAGVGAKIGGNVSDSIWDEAKDIKENFKEGYLGENEYNNRQLDQEFYNGYEWQNMLDDNTLYPNLKGRERRMVLRDTVQKYRNSGITDTKKITTGIRAGLDPEDAIYAIKLAENIGKEDWENPTIRADYQERYKEVLGDSADVIWDNIDKFF